jgi:hypothetical protein
MEFRSSAISQGDGDGDGDSDGADDCSCYREFARFPTKELSKLGHFAQESVHLTHTKVSGTSEG